MPSDVDLILRPFGSDVSADARKLYAALTDIADADLVLKIVTKARFRIYMDKDGVGANDITSA